LRELKRNHKRSYFQIWGSREFTFELRQENNPLADRKAALIVFVPYQVEH
jgi:hypothetical protein